MFWTLMIILHILVCLLMILMILLQSGKGADIGAVFGGGSSQTVFGSAGPGTFLSKLTIAGAVLFMVTSITLSYFSGPTPGTTGSVMEGVQEQPAQTSTTQPGKTQAQPTTPAATPVESGADGPDSAPPPETSE